MEKEEYNISHIVVTKFTTNSNLEMTGGCLSDDLTLYENP